MISYRQYLRHTKVGKLTLQQFLKRADRSKERLSLKILPSEEMKNIWFKYTLPVSNKESADLNQNYLIAETNDLIKSVVEAEKEYQKKSQSLSKSLTALMEVSKLFDEEFPEASKEEKAEFLKEKLEEIKTKQDQLL